MFSFRMNNSIQSLLETQAHMKSVHSVQFSPKDPSRVPARLNAQLGRGAERPAGRARLLAKGRCIGRVRSSVHSADVMIF